MGNSHSHHHHCHDHGSKTGRRLLIAFVLNFTFAIIELVGGLYTNSVAILSDAIHDLGDSLALGLAYFFEKLSLKNRDKSYHFGYRRYSVLAAFVNGIVLCAGSVFVLFEAVPRLITPEKVNVEGMIGFALLGIVVNGAAVLNLKKGGKSLNERLVLIHLLEDVIGWVAVLIVSIVMYFKELPILDPLLSILISLWVLKNVVLTGKQTLRVFLQAAPIEVSEAVLRDEFLMIEGVLDLHHVQIWTLDGESHVFSGHVVISTRFSINEIEALKVCLREVLKSYHIDQSTIELELENSNCETQ